MNNHDDAIAHCCAECGKEEGVSLKMCKSCLETKYCDATCQKNHWPNVDVESKPGSELNPDTMAFFVSIKRKLVSIISSSYGSKRVDDEEEEEEEDRQRTCKRQRRGAHPSSNPVSESTTMARSMAVISDSCKQLTATICCRILTIVLGGVSVCLAKRIICPVLFCCMREAYSHSSYCNQCRLG